MLTFPAASSLVGGASREGGGASTSTTGRSRTEEMSDRFGSSLFHHLSTSIQPAMRLKGTEIETRQCMYYTIPKLIPFKVIEGERGRGGEVRNTATGIPILSGRLPT